ncbi:hypothetical protein Ciccas_014347, partial [Cichlidogyrus casuarinus]
IDDVISRLTALNENPLLPDFEKLEQMDCIFCKILNRTLSANILYDDENLVIIEDHAPQAQHHWQCIIKRHLPSLYFLSTADFQLSELNPTKLIHIFSKQQFKQDSTDIFVKDQLQLQTGNVSVCHWILLTFTSVGIRKPPFNTIPHLSFHILAPESSVVERWRFDQSSKSPFFISASDLTNKVKYSGYNKLMKQTFSRLSLGNSCVFCRIINKSEPARVVYATENIVVFWDRKPRAAIHLQSVPKSHIKNVNYLNSSHVPMLNEIKQAGLEALRLLKGDESDVQLGFHVPPYYSVPHLHMHVISPTRDLSWIYKKDHCFRKIDDLISKLS